MNDTTDWFDVTSLGEGRYQVSEGEGQLPCHSFVVTDGGEAVLIDTGLGVGDLRETVVDLAGVVPRVVLTHSHWDHIGAAHQFDDVVIDERERGADGRVAIDSLTDEFNMRPGQFVAGWLEQGKEFPDGFDPDSYAIEPVDDVGLVEPGETLSVGSIPLEVIGIPGHSSGQLALLDRDAGICFGADLVEPGSGAHAHLEFSDLDVYRETMDRVIDYRDEGAFDTIVTGHCEPIEDLSILDDMKTALEAVADGTAAYTVIETNYGPTREYSVAGVDVLTSD